MDIFVCTNGRGSTRGVYNAMTSDSRLVLRYTNKKGHDYYRVHTDHNAEFTRNKITSFNFDNIIVRWGNHAPIDTDGRIVYNKAEAIKLASNKKQSRKLLLEKGVSCPALVNRDNTEFPIIARPMSHSQGKSFVVLNNRSQFLTHYNAHEPQGWYYSKVIPKDKEYRVHCAHGKILEIMEKPRPASNDIAWNQAGTGLPFVRVKREEYNTIPNFKQVCIEALKAVKELGLDFSGVDVITQGTNVYVLECNTSQSIENSPHVTERYAKYFDWLARSESRREHFDFTQWTKGKSFVFKNFQLLDQVGERDE